MFDISLLNFCLPSLQELSLMYAIECRQNAAALSLAEMMSALSGMRSSGRLSFQGCTLVDYRQMVWKVSEDELSQLPEVHLMRKRGVEVVVL